MELAGGLPIYVAVDEYEKLKDTLDAKLAEYSNQTQS
jgi:hypothetical protein